MFISVPIREVGSAVSRFNTQVPPFINRHACDWIWPFVTSAYRPEVCSGMSDLILRVSVQSYDSNSYIMENPTGDVLRFIQEEIWAEFIHKFSSLVYGFSARVQESAIQPVLVCDAAIWSAGWTWWTGRVTPDGLRCSPCMEQMQWQVQCTLWSSSLEALFLL